jgi:hypothetical protein
MVAGVDLLRAELTRAAAPSSRPVSRGPTLALLAAALCACAQGEGRPPAPEAATPTAAAVPTVEQLVDSSLRSFRQGLPTTTRLDGGAESRDALVARFTRAAAAGDTAALRTLLVTRAEYAWLYFPDARLAKPPYGIDPGFLWLQLASNTDRDLPKAVGAVAGGGYGGHRCEGDVAVEGPNRLHERCLVAVTRGARVDTLSLFGSILERDGRFKFLSYANRL